MTVQQAQPQPEALFAAEVRHNGSLGALSVASPDDSGRDHKRCPSPTDDRQADWMEAKANRKFKSGDQPQADYKREEACTDDSYTEDTHDPSLLFWLADQRNSNGQPDTSG
jgi:hypothetical protein